MVCSSPDPFENAAQVEKMAIKLLISLKGRNSSKRIESLKTELKDYDKKNVTDKSHMNHSSSKPENEALTEHNIQYVKELANVRMDDLIDLKAEKEENGFYDFDSQMKFHQQKTRRYKLISQNFERRKRSVKNTINGLQQNQSRMNDSFDSMEQIKNEVKSIKSRRSRRTTFTAREQFKTINSNILESPLNKSKVSFDIKNWKSSSEDLKVVQQFNPKEVQPRVYEPSNNEIKLGVRQ